jgi:hypothetical protein
MDSGGAGNHLTECVLLYKYGSDLIENANKKLRLSP